MNNNTPQFVIKRDGTFVPFEFEKIVKAIFGAASETEEFGQPESELLARNVVAKLEEQHSKSVPMIESIQDIVEEVLVENNHLKTAKAYILYREQHAKLRSEQQSFVNAVSTVDEYIDRLDWRVKANANLGYSLGGLILNLSGKVIANYWLNRIYIQKVAEAHINGFIYIHDLDMLSGYCAGWSLKMLIQEGFNGVGGKAEASPPRHLSTAFSQVVNFLGTLQNEWAGAQAFSSFDTYMAPFIKIDNLDYSEVYQEMQSFIYNLNVPTRWGTQTPFTNLTFDWVCPDDLQNEHPIIGGVEQDFTYGSLQKEMNMINKAYIEVMTRGDAKGRVFTFPIPTYNITKDFDWDGENVDILFEMTAKYGIPYFQNFINSDLSPNMIRSMCCRLQLDLRELLKRGNSLFGSAEQTGSIGVVTINCARLGYLHKGDEVGLIAHLDDLLKLSKTSLELKRKVVARYLDEGLYPFTKRYLGTLKNHFSTIGVNGMNEMVRNFSGDSYDIVSQEGKALTVRILDHIREMLVEFQVDTGHLYNLEATPAEGCMYRFAKEDAKRYPDIIQAGFKDAPYYTNSSQLPANYTDDLFEALDHQEELQRKYTGGTVVHLFMGERISDYSVCKNLIKKVLTRYKIPYITLTPTFSICPIHGYLQGEHCFCPKCDNELRHKKRVSANSNSESSPDESDSVPLHRTSQ
ncbi:MAG: ribonucleoside triphosphate reductase [Holosporales bacterium]|jgi:ribonucleoside-triphosphate reductase|nr:ribonucleoside triphosphate reductase [Holosporales bacterium]